MVGVFENDGRLVLELVEVEVRDVLLHDFCGPGLGTALGKFAIDSSPEVSHWPLPRACVLLQVLLEHFVLLVVARTLDACFQGLRNGI